MGLTVTIMNEMISRVSRLRSGAAIAATMLALAGLPHGASAQANVSCDAFVKNPDGSWVALDDSPVRGVGQKLTIRRGSVLRPGAAILGVDMAALLDEQCPAVLPSAPANSVPLPVVPGTAGPVSIAPPDLQGRLADEKGNIDIQAFTCAQLVSTTQADAEFVLLWASGWHSGQTRRSTLNVAQIRQRVHSVIAYCQANKDKRLSQAIDAVAKAERR